MINLISIVSCVPEIIPPPPPHIWRFTGRIHETLLTGLLAMIYYSQTVRMHSWIIQKRQQAEKSISDFLLPSPSSEGMHLCVLLSLETKSAIMCNVSAQGTH